MPQRDATARLRATGALTRWFGRTVAVMVLAVSVLVVPGAFGTTSAGAHRTSDRGSAAAKPATAAGTAASNGTKELSVSLPNVRKRLRRSRAGKAVASTAIGQLRTVRSWVQEQASATSDQALLESLREQLIDVENALAAQWNRWTSHNRRAFRAEQLIDSLMDSGAAATDDPPSHSADPAAPSDEVVPTAAQWEALRQCESSGNYTIVSAGGRYRGAYQFSQATWESVGGAGDPAAASVAEQDKRALVLFVRSGAGQWGRCAGTLTS